MLQKVLAIAGAIAGLSGGLLAAGKVIGESGPVHAVTARVDAQEKRVDELRDLVRETEKSANETATESKLTRQAVQQWLESERRNHGHE